MFKNCTLFVIAISMACIALSAMVAVNTYIQPAPTMEAKPITVADPATSDECMNLYKGPDNEPRYRVGPC